MKLLKKIIKNEDGIVLPMALVLLVLGSLLVAPMLSLVATNLNANLVIDDLDMELYAADAGIENTLWAIKNDTSLVLPAEGEDPLPIYLPEGESNEVNGKAVTVNVSHSENQTYKVTSIATSLDGTSTTVESYISVEYFDFSWLLDNAITSPGTVDLKNNVDVTGGIACPEEPTGNGEYDEWTEDPIAGWPSEEDFEAYYLAQAQGLTPESSPHEINVSAGTIEVPTPIGPLLASGDVDITGSGVAKLEGNAYGLCMYVTGDLTIYNGCTFDLNGSTIFVQGNVEFKNGCTFIGSGCIISVGELIFKTNGDTDPDGFIFLMSLNDKVDVRNGDNIYGSIAGDAFVEMKNGCDMTLSGVPEGGLNLPGADDEGNLPVDEVGIIDYKIL